MLAVLRSVCFSVVISVLSACGQSAPPTAATAEAALPKRIDAALDSAVRDQRVVGAVLLVSQDGQLVYHRAVGLADRESARPMREDAIFLYASMTKPIVATTALALIDSGALQLDEPITQHLPDFKPQLADGSTPTINVRQLLTHTSGLGYGFTESLDGPYHR
ncbi:MAG: serine hydrolase domain-containing protein, partial [Polyangiales bacterium]